MPQDGKEDVSLGSVLGQLHASAPPEDSQEVQAYQEAREDHQPQPQAQTHLPGQREL